MATTRKTSRRSDPTKGVSKVLRGILEEQGRQRQAFEDHGRDDHRQFTDMRREFVNLPKKSDIEELKALLFEKDLITGELAPRFATSKDVAPVVQFYKNLVLSAKITTNGSKWISRIVLGLLAFIMGLGLLTGYFKAGIVGLAAWALHK